MNQPDTMRPRVAFQGERGAFSEEAARKLLGESIELVPRPTFESLFEAIDDQSADYLLVPIENSLVGSVPGVHELMLGSSLQVCGEVLVPIRQCLIGCVGSCFQNIKTVESHPMALAQCARFFAENPQVQKVEAEDTAGSVANVVTRGDPTCAAIAGSGAAKLYGGVVLREHLEDHPENQTRFVLLGAASAGQARLPNLETLYLESTYDD